MNKENKYYIPKVEEFYVGFKYEIKDWDGFTPDGNSHKSFHKAIFEGMLDGQNGTYKISFDRLSELIKEEEVRVKYLDKEDIESLGWKLIKEYKSPYTKYTLYNFHINIERGFNTGTHYYLNLLDNNKIQIEIRTYGSYDTFNNKMEFNIKNKSELIKLMKQLGI